MLRKVLASAAAVLAFGICDLEAAQINSTWVGGCCELPWSDASNWDPAIVPDNDGNTFAVVINANTNYVDVVLTQNRTIDQLDCYSAAEYNIDFGGSDVTLTFASPNGLTNYGNLGIADLANVAVDIMGNVRNYGSLDFAGEIDIDGSLENFEDAELSISAGETFVEYGGLVNSGLLFIEFSGTLTVEPNLANFGDLQIVGGTCDATILDNNSTGTINGFGFLYTEVLLRNKGDIYAAGGPLALISDGSIINTGTLGNKALSTLNIQQAEDVNNNGTIEVNAGGGVAFDCNLVNEPNGVIKLLGGTLAATTITQTPDANFTGFGTIVGDVIINPNGIIELTGPTNIVGDVNIQANATLEISDGQTLITGHTTCDGTIRLIGGTVVFQGGCDCEDCNIINEAGIDRNHFDLNADGIEDFKDFAYFAETWLWQASWY